MTFLLKNFTQSQDLINEQEICETIYLIFNCSNDIMFSLDPSDPYNPSGLYQKKVYYLEEMESYSWDNCNDKRPKTKF